MSTTIFIRAREPDNGRRLIDELLQSGFDPARLHVYGRRLPPDLPVAATTWRTGPEAMLPGAVAGALVLPAVVWVALPLHILGLLALAAGGGFGGAAWSIARRRRSQGALEAQRQALEDGEMMIAASVDDAQIKSVEDRIAERHPELLVLGADASGSPPFP